MGLGLFIAEKYWIGRRHWSAQVDNLKNGRNLHIKGIWSRRGQKESDKKKFELPAGN